MGKPKKIFFIPDQHFPYNDKRYWKVLINAIKYWKPDYLVVMGDFFDFYCVSAYNKNPNRKKLLDQEIAEGNAALRQLERFKCKKIFVCGNHEERLERYLTNRAPEIYNIVSVQKLFNLGDKWEYVPYRDFYKLGELFITHDVGRAGKYAAYHSLNDFQDNLAIAHTHRGAVVYSGSVSGKSHVCGMFGWGGSVEDIDYMHQAVAKREWQLGWGRGYMDDKGVVYLTFDPVIEYRACIEGKIITE